MQGDLDAVAGIGPQLDGTLGIFKGGVPAVFLELLAAVINAVSTSRKRQDVRRDVISGAFLSIWARKVARLEILEAHIHHRRRIVECAFDIT